MRIATRGMKRNPFVYLLTKKVAQLVFSLFYQIETQVQETFPQQGPMIILPKHQSWTDIPLVGLAFSSPLYFVAKKELFRYPLLRHYFRLGGAIPVDRERSIRTLGSFKKLMKLLKMNERIVIFPEGTYVRNIVGTGKSRLLQMVLKFQEEFNIRIPFIPVGIHYGDKKGWRRQVQICVGSPLFAEKESDAIFLTERAMEEISRLCRLPRYHEKSKTGNPKPEIDSHERQRAFETTSSKNVSSI